MYRIEPDWQPFGMGAKRIYRLYQKRLFWWSLIESFDDWVDASARLRVLTETASNQSWEPGFNGTILPMGGIFTAWSSIPERSDVFIPPIPIMARWTGIILPRSAAQVHLNRRKSNESDHSNTCAIRRGLFDAPICRYGYVVEVGRIGNLTTGGHGAMTITETIKQQCNAAFNAGMVFGFVSGVFTGAAVVFLAQFVVTYFG